MTSSADESTLKDEIARLEAELSLVRSQLQLISSSTPSEPDEPAPPPPKTLLPSHPLLLLSDSALPLGSFAFSSGLESYLAHHPNTPGNTLAAERFHHFLSLTLTSLATSTLPYLIAAYTKPPNLQDLDAELDACTLCPVARRASVAQGRALLTLWDRALGSEAGPSEAATALSNFSQAMKTPNSRLDDAENIALSGHFAPVWAAVTCALGISLHSSAYTFLFSHAKAVVSAAVRASVMGPYKAQEVLASGWLRGKIEGVMGANWERKVEEAGQGVVMCDLWIGRHELLYSRIFNS
ncbi:hypothetical protein JMJ35_005036 [Cladonia borealis]|uniref:Urease accessory protein UreF n=1 Tax=Cladonia borealis TaxID=184061 RepID=A0AA39R3N2_9LECA|nr:hypothetical protein JMJ35_005036 [Cladonia borealis]